METVVGKSGVTKVQMGDFLRCKAKAQKVRNQALWQQIHAGREVLKRIEKLFCIPSDEPIRGS